MRQVSCEQAGLGSIKAVFHPDPSRLPRRIVRQHSNIKRLPLSTHSSDAFDPREWISQAEASRIRGVSRQAIAKLVANGRLRSLELGGRTFVCRSDVVEFVPLPGGRPKGDINE